METIQRSETIRRGLLTAAGVAILLVAWTVVSALFFTNPSGTPGPVPQPLIVVAEVVRLLGRPATWAAIGATTGSAATGFAIGVLIAIVLGVIVMLVPILEQFASQLGVIAACLPAAAIAPLVVMLAPVGTRTVSVVLAVLAVLFPCVVGVLLGLRAATPAQLDVVAAFGGSRWTAVRTVRSIAAVPAVVAALKIAAPSAMLGAIVGEYFIVGVDSGLGLLLVSKQYVADYAGMWAVAVICALVAGTGFALVAIAGRVVAPWTDSGEGRTA